MSDKGRVFKAHTINDNVHHCQLNEHFTARRDNESLHHFILRLLGFCLFAYRHDLCYVTPEKQRDVYAKNDFDDYIAIEVFTGDIKVLNVTS